MDATPAGRVALQYETILWDASIQRASAIRAEVYLCCHPPFKEKYVVRKMKFKAPHTVLGEGAKTGSDLNRLLPEVVIFRFDLAQDNAQMRLFFPLHGCRRRLFAVLRIAPQVLLEPEKVV